jgi:hypothetical protein
MRRSLILPVAGLLVAGCASSPAPPAPPASQAWRVRDSFPASGMITQRALFTTRGRQFALNGFLALSGTGDRRLVVLETFGHVMADVLVKADGRVFVMQSSRMFSAKWIRRYVVADMRCIFGAAPDGCPVTMPEPNRFVLNRRGYSLDVRILEAKSGPQPAALFDETHALKQ